MMMMTRTMPTLNLIIQVPRLLRTSHGALPHWQPRPLPLYHAVNPDEFPGHGGIYPGLGPGP
eukprot:2912424-Rhodomonas_salina.2